MREGFSVCWLKPDRCSLTYRENFAELVRKGGEVDNDGLLARIARAERLVFLRQEDVLVGIAALKNPDAGYRSKIENKAAYPLAVDAIRFELGWVFVEKEGAFRGRSLSRVLTDCALAGVHDGVFATSRSDNDPMHRTLTRFDFVRAGVDYDPEMGEHRLQLFVRPVQR